ncbi:MAG: hypothetical protein ACRCY3_00130 [Sphingorhabdus sp.]
MPKPRRKQEIRQSIQHEIETLKQKRGESRRTDWRGIALDALLNGHSITAAARLAGVKRTRIYVECNRCAQFDRAFQLARHYARIKFQWVSRPIWPPSTETIQRHEETFQRISEGYRYQLVGNPKWF